MQAKEQRMDGASHVPHVVIIGGGFGGLKAARTLRRANVQVTIVDRYNHHLFQPLLYQVAMAGLSPADIAYPIRTVLRSQKNTHTLLAEVTDVDIGAREVHLHDGTKLAYDFLIVACGARTNFFGKELDWGRYALGLKSIEDAVEIRRRVLLAFETAERELDPVKRRALLTFVVIGGGPTGVELAGALSELSRRVLAKDFRVIDPTQARVVLVEAQDRLLLGGFDLKLAQKAQEQLEELGVEVRLNSPVKTINERGAQVADEFIESGVVLWTAGVRARSLTQKLGVELDKAGRIVVGPDCSVPGHPELFAVGDCARFLPDGADKPLPGVAQVALQQGELAARNIERTLAGEMRLPFRYRDKGLMATIGRSRAIAQTAHVKVSGFIAWMMWLVVHLWFLLGARNRLMVFLNWCWNYITYRRGARLITGWRAWEWSPKGNVMAAQYAGLGAPDLPETRAPLTAREEKDGKGDGQRSQPRPL